MKRQKSPPQKMSRMMSLILLMAALPFILHTLNEKLSPKRKVASDGGLSSVGTISDSFDLSEASPEEFKKAFKYQILKNVEVDQFSDGPGIKLGLFLMKSPAGSRVFVCDRYPTVDLLFSAEGVAISGEIPKMVVRIPCVVSDDQNHIAAFPIPFARIFASPVSDFEFDITAPGIREGGKIFFRNVVDEWPREWAWTGVKFYGKDASDTLEITGYEVISVLGEPLVLPQGQ
ncbi:hypothetical protein [Bdellovibrio bacteriovorus]|nr:hypothetical protein [Bdellovibrio bacteriovorus]